MRRLAKVALALAAPLAIGSGLAIAPPAFASAGCAWGAANGGTVTATPGNTVSANGVVFQCSSSGGGNPSYSWIPAGTTTGGDTFNIVTSYDPSANNANFSPGAALQGSNGDAYEFGSSWVDVGSWDAYENGVTGCEDSTCGFGGDTGLLLP